MPRSPRSLLGAAATFCPTPPDRPALRRAAASLCLVALMAAPPPGSVPVLKRRSENRVLEDVKKVALKHCDGLVKEFVDCTKVRVVRLCAVLRSFDGAPCCCSAQLRWLLI